MILSNYIVLTLCSIATLLHSSALLSMQQTEFGIVINPPRSTRYQRDSVDKIEQKFFDGITSYGLGNTKKAERLLKEAYHYGKEYNFLHLVYPAQLKAACNLLYTINNEKGNTQIALEYILDPTEKGLLCKHLAQKAHAEEKFDLEKEYYAKAFNLFGQSYKTDAQAQKHYENALWCGRGYEYDPRIIQNYYLSRLQDAYDIHHSYLDGYTYRLSHLITNQALAKLSKLAHDDPSTQCILARIYLDGRDAIQPDHSKAIALCRDALCSLAIMPIGQSLDEYNDLPVMIEALRKSLHPEIQHRALTLERYSNIVFAIKKGDLIALEKLANLYHHDATLASLPLKLLCSSVNSNIREYLHNLTFNNETADAQAFKEFCESEEGELAAHILEWVLPDISITSELEDFFHLVLGGYAYHHNKYDAAIAEFTQYSTYKDDLYLQALVIQMDTNANTTSQKEKILSLPLHKIITCPSHNKKYVAAKKIIADICGYNDSVSTENILLTCQEWIPKLAVLNNNEYSYECIHALMGLNDLRKKTDLTIEQQQAMAQLTTLFDFFSLLQAHDQKGLDAFFSKKNEYVKGIRRTILQAIRGNKKNDLQKIDLESNAFKNFCVSDLSLLKIIEHIEDHPQERFKIKPAQCRYLLDGYAELQKEDYLATALFLQAKTFETTSAQDMLTTLEPCIALLNQIKKNDRTHSTETIIANKIIASHKEYINLLLEKKDYEQAYRFALYLAQSDRLIPSQIVCNTFTAIEKSILQETHHAYHILLEIPDRISTYNMIKELADQKKSDCCDCIAFILYEHSRSPHLEASDRTALEKECLNYLSYSLKDENRTNDEDKRIKRSLYNQLACYFGILEKSISLLDEAIKYDSARALYEKAILLSRKKPINHDDLPTIIKLLEQHIASDDSEFRRGKSCKTLGKYYFSINELESQKKAFEYFKAACKLGNHYADYFLAFFYINGIEGYQAPDIEKGLTYLQNTIDGKKNNLYANARYIRASTYYQENRYTQAHEDLVALFEYPECSDSQKLFAYWLTGLTKLQLNENKDLSKDITSYFRTAYETALSYKSENPNSPFIKQFILCYHENSVLTIQKNIDHIIENKRTDAASLDFCTVMGAVIFEQCATKPIEDPLRQLAVKSLLYATQNGSNEAPFSLLCTAEEEVDTWDEIYHLVRLRISAPHLIEAINPLLADRYPTDVISQGILLKRLVEKNDPQVLNNYKSELYEHRKPIAADPVSYTIFSHETAEKTIADCSGLTSLIELADAFMQHPAKSTPDEHFMAMWYGSLLAYSLDEKLLHTGMDYLETCRQYFPTIQQKHIEKNLGYIYYKLGWKQYKQSDLESAIFLLQKGTFLGNKLCNDLFIKITQEQTALKTKIKTISSAIIQNINAIYVICEKIIQSPHYINLVHQATDTLENQEELHTNTMSVMNQKFSRKDYFKEYDDPLICFNYLFDNYQQTTNNSNLQEALQKAIHLSTHNGMFSMKSTLERLCTFTKKIIEKNNKQQMELLFKVIKQELIKQKINMKAFEGLYKDIYKINLSQNIIWKKVK